MRRRFAVAAFLVGGCGGGLALAGGWLFELNRTNVPFYVALGKTDHASTCSPGPVRLMGEPLPTERWVHLRAVLSYVTLEARLFVNGKLAFMKPLSSALPSGDTQVGAVIGGDARAAPPSTLSTTTSG